MLERISPPASSGTFGSLDAGDPDQPGVALRRRPGHPETAAGRPAGRGTGGTGSGCDYRPGRLVERTSALAPTRFEPWRDSLTA